MAAQRSVLLVGALLLATAAWFARPGGGQAEPPGNAERRAALQACRQRVEGTDVSICVPDGWIAVSVGRDRRGEPQTTSEPVAYDGNAFNLELHDGGGQLLARAVMLGPIDDSKDDSPTGKLLAKAYAPNPQLGAAFERSDDPAAQAQAVLASVVTSWDGPNNQPAAASALPPGTVPGAVTILHAPAIFQTTSWNVVRGDRRYIVNAVRNPLVGPPVDQAVLDAAVTSILRTWTWHPR